VTFSGELGDPIALRPYGAPHHHVRATLARIRDTAGRSSGTADRSRDAADRSRDAADRSRDAADRSRDAADHRRDATPSLDTHLVLITSPFAVAGGRAGMTGHARLYGKRRSLAYAAFYLPLQRLLRMRLWSL
jgi:hypothetical protein